MKTPLRLAVAASMLVLVAESSAAGAGHHSRIHQPGDRAQEFRAPGNAHPRHGNNNGGPAGTAAGLPSFHQPSYSIDRKEWWLPHPYFQSNGQGYGYPTRPIVRPRGRHWSGGR